MIFIEKVKIGKDKNLLIKPRDSCFDKIYRSAMGVRWDSDNKYLYFCEPIEHESDIIFAYKQIIVAVKTEYGKDLVICDSTEFSGIEEKIKNEITTM